MQSLAFLQNLSSWELILIFMVVLLFFGAKRLPELFRSFGKSMKEFKKATSEIEDDIRTAMDDEPTPVTKADSSKTVEAAPTSEPQPAAEPVQQAETPEPPKSDETKA